MTETNDQQRSWRTRMASVLRQFAKLTEEDHFDYSTGTMVKIVGLCHTNGGVRLTVAPNDDPLNRVYSTDLEELEI